MGELHLFDERNVLPAVLEQVLRREAASLSPLTGVMGVAATTLEHASFLVDINVLLEATRASLQPSLFGTPATDVGSGFNLGRSTAVYVSGEWRAIESSTDRALGAFTQGFISILDTETYADWIERATVVLQRRELRDLRAQVHSMERSLDELAARVAAIESGQLATPKATGTEVTLVWPLILSALETVSTELGLSLAWSVDESERRAIGQYEASASGAVALGRLSFYTRLAEILDTATFEALQIFFDVKSTPTA